MPFNVFLYLLVYKLNFLKARGFCPFHLPMYAKGLEGYLTYNRQLVNVHWIKWFIYLYLLVIPWSHGPLSCSASLCLYFCTGHKSLSVFWLTHSNSNFVGFTSAIRMTCSSEWRQRTFFKRTCFSVHLSIFLLPWCFVHYSKEISCVASSFKSYIIFRRLLKF